MTPPPSTSGLKSRRARPNRTSGERDVSQPQVRDQTEPSFHNATNPINSGEADRPGQYLTGPVTLPSGTTLSIDPDAVLLASSDAADYPPDGSHLTPLLSSRGTSNVTITGGGSIDGQGAPWWAVIKAEKVAGRPLSPRPPLVALSGVHNARVDGITLRNAPNAHLALQNVDNATIVHTTIAAPADSPNTDGIDIKSSQHVTVVDSDIADGDDNVAITSGPGAPASDITVAGCRIGVGHGLSIGSYTGGGVHNVRFHDNVLTGTTSGIRIKSARDRGGEVSAISYVNLAMTGVPTPILITAYYPKVPADGDPAQPVTTTTPYYHDIDISNVTATGADQAGQVVGLPERPIQDLTLRAVQIASRTGLIVRNAEIDATATTITPASGAPYLPQSGGEVHEEGQS